jgi:uncharacterized protein (DUF952 family)
MTRIFHLIRAVDHEAHLATGGGAWSPPSLSTEGFIHMSTAAQLAGTLALHFQDVTAVTLLEVDAQALEDNLRWEASRDGQLFPHLYRSLRPVEVLRGWHLTPNQGAWSVPRFGESAAQDAPDGDATASFLVNE